MARIELSSSPIRALALSALVLFAAGSAAAAPSLASIRVNRSSGVAPLAVLFDASATTDPAFSREFHSLQYEWDFGDPDSGTWPISGQSRNGAIGGVAGHLFTEGGSYTVTLTITNPAGQSITRTTTIDVEAEDDHAWSGSYCYANGSNFSGCPSGSTHVGGVSSMNSAFSGRMGANTRHLFRRGDTFSLTPYAHPANGPILIGAYGSGARPVINSSASGNTVMIQTRNDWRVIHLDFRNGGPPIGQPGDSSFSVTNATGWDLNMDGVFTCLQYWNRANPHVSGLAFVDITCRPTGNKRWIWHRSVDTMYLGMDIDASDGPNPPMRGMLMRHTVFQHSRVVGSSYGGIFTLRGCGQSEAGCAGDLRNQYNIFSDNRFFDTENSRTIRTCLNHECDSGGSNGNQAEHFIFERNLFEYDYSGASASQLNSVFWLEGSDMTIRNNIFDLTDLSTAFNTALIEVSPRGPTVAGGASANRDNHTFAHNTVVWTGAAHDIVLCRNSASGGSHLCANNLLYSPNAGRTISSGGGWTVQGNMRDTIEYNGYPFSVPYSQIDGPEDFKLAPSVAPVDAGSDLSSLNDDHVYLDFFHGCREAGSVFDVGAHELGASVCAAGGGGSGGEGGGGELQPPAAPILLP